MTEHVPPKTGGPRSVVAEIDFKQDAHALFVAENTQTKVGETFGVVLVCGAALRQKGGGFACQREQGDF